MTYEERVVSRRESDPVVSTTNPRVTGPVEVDRAVVDRSVAVNPSGGEMARRLVVLLFGLIQVLILLRIGLLLLDAREGNSLVAAILSTSQLFVAPFEGIFRTDALHAGGSVLDVAAIAAIVGWTILEIVFLWFVALFRREPA